MGGGGISGELDLPRAVERRVKGLKGLQVEHAKLELKFQEEILELEKRYLQHYQPLYNRRSEIVNGTAEVKETEIEQGEALMNELGLEDAKSQAQKETEDENEDDEIKGIPHFWLTAMKNMMTLGSMITEGDEEVLKQLIDIKLEYLSVPGFKLTFTFGENDFFENRELTKSYFYQQQAGYGGDFIYDHAEGDSIVWKEDKDLTTRTEVKKQRNKSEFSLFRTNHRYKPDTHSKEKCSTRVILLIFQPTYATF